MKGDLIIMAKIVTRGKKENKVVEDNKNTMKEVRGVMEEIKRVVNAERIENVDGSRELAYATPCPIYYDGDVNKMIPVPNPYLLVIGNVQQLVNEMGLESVIGSALRNNDVETFNRAMSQLKELVSDVIVSAYSDSIFNGLLTFISYRLSVNIEAMQLDPGVVLTDIINRNHIGRQVRELHDRKVLLNAQLSNGTISIEDCNAIILYYVFVARDSIMNELAIGLNALLRSLAFGVPYERQYYRNPKAEFNSTEEGRANYMSLICKDISEIDVKTSLFHQLSCEFTAQISMIGPLVEALLWQVVSAVDHMYTEELAKFRGRRYDPYDDRY